MLIQKSFYFIRHGQTDSNLHSICQGHLDIPLNDTGRAQAHEAKVFIPTEEISHIFYSPLQRAQETMHIVTAHIDVPKIPMDHLKERHWGDYQGQPIAVRLNQETPPNGETRQDFINRIIIGFNSALEQSNVPLFVAHGGVFRTLGIVLNVETIGIGNCELVKFIAPEDSEQPWKLVRFKKSYE